MQAWSDVHAVCAKLDKQFDAPGMPTHPVCSAPGQNRRTNCACLFPPLVCSNPRGGPPDGRQIWWVHHLSALAVHPCNPLCLHACLHTRIHTHNTSHAALVEALVGFQFNAVGGGTKTRRSVRTINEPAMVILHLCSHQHKSTHSCHCDTINLLVPCARLTMLEAHNAVPTHSLTHICARVHTHTHTRTHTHTSAGPLPCT